MLNSLTRCERNSPRPKPSQTNSRLSPWTDCGCLIWQSQRSSGALGGRNSSPDPLPPRRPCFATGELAEPVDTTGVIKGVPGGNPSGTIFLSFDKEAFCSFGLEKAYNATLSADAELKIRSALSQLIERSRAQKLV